MPSTTPRRPGRRSPPPPAILRAPGETLEGADILDEFRGALGVLLWRAVRSVTLWSAVPAGERTQLFAPASARRWLRDAAAPEAPRPLRRLLRTLASVLASTHAGSERRAAHACLEVSRWAEREGAPGTALCFAQASACAAPADAAGALATGVLALQRGQDARAESWLRRALVLARRQADRSVHAEACLHLGGLLERRGQKFAAERLYLRAARLARRSGLRHVRSDALLALFRKAARGDAREAAEYARAAFGALGPADARVSELAYELACFYLAREDHAAALPLLKCLLPHGGTVASPALLLACIARAAAGTGDRALYADASGRAWERLVTSEQDPSGTVYLELACAALSLREWEDAERAGQAALGAAQDGTGSSEERDAAETLLKQVWQHRGGMRASVRGSERSSSASVRPRTPS
jgi:tetratricopeptide (TPR) repeat protein